MTKFLINLGLVLIPFFALPGIDVRDIKLTVAVNMALILSLSGIYQGVVCKIKNVWVYLFLLFSLMGYIISPSPTLTLFDMNVGSFWIWQPMYHYIIFFLAIVVISNVKMNLIDLMLTLQIMMWCGFLMACYVILQYFNVDQFFNNVGLDPIGKLAGTVGNPTHVSPFIGMLIPIALYFRRYFFSILMFVAVCLTTSQVALGATLCGLFIYFVWCHRTVFHWFVFISTMCLIMFLLLLKFSIVTPNQCRHLIEDNMRFMTYTQIIKDVNEKPFADSDIRYPLSGWGMGNFKYTFHLAHRADETFQRYLQAHNEYLEVLYNSGIIGFLLLISAIFTFLKEKLFNIYHGVSKKHEIALVSSLICILVSAIGTFVFQIGATLFYTIVIIGLLNNQEVTNA